MTAGSSQVILIGLLAETFGGVDRVDDSGTGMEFVDARFNDCSCDMDH